MESIIFYRYLFSCKFTENGSWKCRQSKRVPWLHQICMSVVQYLPTCVSLPNDIQSTLRVAWSGHHHRTHTYRSLLWVDVPPWDLPWWKLFWWHCIGWVLLGVLAHQTHHSQQWYSATSMMELLVPLWSRPMVANFLLFSISGWLHPRKWSVSNLILDLKLCLALSYLCFQW